MYLGGGGGCAATFSVTLTPHSIEKAQKKSPWNYFTFVCAPLHLQLTGREKNELEEENCLAASCVWRQISKK